MKIGIIPARCASTRLPGKLLLDLAGKPILQRTWERALEAEAIDRVVIAAGDDDIHKAAISFGAEVVDVFDECKSGSDRIWLAAKNLDKKYDLIVNIQGDEPFIDPNLIDNVVEGLVAKSECGVGTAVVPLIDDEEFVDPSRVKVVLDNAGNAIYFSRSAIPYDAMNKQQPAYRHIGIYVYRWNILEQFVSWSEGRLERIENLEQLRLIENGIKIHVSKFEQSGLEINTEQDLENARSLFAT